MKWKKFRIWLLFFALLLAIWENSLGLSLLFAGLLLVWGFGEIENRIIKLERPRRNESSVIKFSVNPYGAIVRNKRFGELVGFKNNTLPFKDWSKSDTEKLWSKNGIRETYKDKLFGVSFTYLPGENAYFVKQHGSDYSNIVGRKMYKTCLYDEWIIENRLSLEVWERIPKFWERGKLPKTEEELYFLTVCIKYQAFKEGGSNRDEFNILCELPLYHLIDRDILGEKKFKEQEKKASDYIEAAGFEAKHDSWPDMPMKDDFGEEPEYSYHSSYYKNGVDIGFQG